MEIREIPVAQLIPYAKNPRKNDKAVDAVAQSIEQFGFKVPCVVDRDNVLVTGHTRVKAAKKLGLKTVPCVVADDLTEEQVKAFRLADNKVGEIADWDWDLLAEEALEINDIDLGDFGFDLDEITYQTDYIEPHEHNANTLKLDRVDMSRVTGKWQMPVLKGTQHVPTDLYPFHWAYPSTCKASEFSKGVHFYIYDWLFERFWNKPENYLEQLSRFDCVLTPDFSLYTDMPLAMQMWNVYRSRLMGKIMEDYGITVIPTLSWCRPDSYEFCFEGIPKHSVVSVSTVGVMTSEDAQKIWVDGMNEAMRVLEPSCVVAYGLPIDYDFTCKVKYIAKQKIEDYGKRG